MKASDKIRSFISLAEGFRLKAYKPLETDRWTIGYGATYINSVPVEEGMEISKEDAISLLNATIDVICSMLSADDKIPQNVSQSQFDAVVSLVFNIGISAFKKSETGSMFYLGKNIADKFPLWNRSGGVVVAGLVERRKKEKEIYEHSIYSYK